jgi:hypothetical protein
MQTRELEEYCQRRDCELAGCYVDNRVSGSKDSRPELDRLTVDARQRKLDVVLVSKLDLRASGRRYVRPCLLASGTFTQAQSNHSVALLTVCGQVNYEQISRGKWTGLFLLSNGDHSVSLRPSFHRQAPGCFELGPRHLGSEDLPGVKTGS